MPIPEIEHRGAACNVKHTFDASAACTFSSLGVCVGDEAPLGKALERSRRPKSWSLQVPYVESIWCPQGELLAKEVLSAVSPHSLKRFVNEKWTDFQDQDPQTDSTGMSEQAVADIIVSWLIGKALTIFLAYSPRDKANSSQATVSKDIDFLM